MHHAARHFASIADFDRVTVAGEMVGCRQAARTTSDNQDSFPGGCCSDWQGPSLLGSHITQKPLHGMDADRAIELAPIATGFAGMIADASVHGWKRIVA